MDLKTFLDRAALAGLNSEASGFQPVASENPWAAPLRALVDASGDPRLGMIPLLGGWRAAGRMPEGVKRLIAETERKPIWQGDVEQLVTKAWNDAKNLEGEPLSSHALDLLRGKAPQMEKMATQSAEADLMQSGPLFEKWLNEIRGRLPL